MNKKFTTLLAGVMLASTFSVGAANINGTATTKYEAGKSYLLGAANSFLTVNADPSSDDYGKLTVGAVSSNLANVNAALWTVTITPAANGGAPKFTFVNKATGLPLSVDYKLGQALKDGTPVAGSVKQDAKLGGASSEWFNGLSTTSISSGSPLMSYFSGDSVVFFGEDGSLYREVASKVSTTATTKALAVQPYRVSDKIVLNATDLNTQLRTLAANAAKDFNLSFMKDVTTGADNIFTASSLTALDESSTELADNNANATAGYVKLLANGKTVKDKDDKDVAAYIVVDTAYFTGTESSGKLIKFSYANKSQKAKNDVKRLDDSYLFKFSFDPTSDSLFIQSKAYVQRGDDAFAKANNNSHWNAAATAPATLTQIKDAYIRLAILEDKRVLTMSSTSETDIDWDTEAWKDQYINTKITSSIAGGTYIPTSLAEGVYMIKLRTSGLKANGQKRNYESDGDNLIANLAGKYGYMPEQRNQNFDHMPAAQWVVKKNGTSATAPVEIYNREFADQNTNNSSYKLSGQLFKAGENVFFAGSDTLEFIPVSKASVENDKLGYKYVTENDTKVQTYLFNYLHGLADDKFLNVPADKDSIVRVDENGEKANLRLQILVKDDKYGYDNSLTRNVYLIVDQFGRGLAYDAKLKKYVLSKAGSSTYFLKENNDKDGKHYYALIPANTFYGDYIDQERKNWKRAYDEDGNALDVVRDSKITWYYYADDQYTDLEKGELKENAKLTKTTSTFTSTSYASSKVSVDDNTLDLLNGNIEDKFEALDKEARTSAFAVEIDDAPLYRRFNVEALGESKTDGSQSLAFVESVRNEYLMDEMNPNLQDKVVDYAGIWNAEKAGGKLFFHVDTAWVNRELGYIKPQYLISVARNDQDGVATEPCTEPGPHIDANGHITDDPYQCVHANRGKLGFVYGKYLVNFSDSAQVLKDAKVKTNPYMVNSEGTSNNSYTRVGFVSAIKVGDSLVVLTNGFEKLEPAKLDTAKIFKNYRDNKLENFIVDLTGDKHKNVTWSFRYVNPEKAAAVTENCDGNAFLIESNVYGAIKDGFSDFSEGNGYRTVVGDADPARAIAPVSAAAWLKMHNGCLVLTDSRSQFSTAKTNGDGALIFNVEQMAEGDEFVTSNDEVAVEGISVIAGNGTVTVQGAAGKSVVITNILGKVVAETVLTSDNATISVPAGIVAVAVDGEEAVKAIVK